LADADHTDQGQHREQKTHAHGKKAVTEASRHGLNIDLLAEGAQRHGGDVRFVDPSRSEDMFDLSERVHVFWGGEIIGAIRQQLMRDTTVFEDDTRDRDPQRCTDVTDGPQHTLSHPQLSGSSICTFSQPKTYALQGLLLQPLNRPRVKDFFLAGSGSDSDCYEQLCSLGELDSRLGGSHQVIVAFMRDNVLLGEGGGMARIINTGDKAGARRVFNITHIRVLTPPLEWETPHRSPAHLC
jgi:hypothetical protein